MQMMNFSELRNKEHPTARNRQDQQQHPSGWKVETIDAPFYCLRISSEGLKHITEIASIDLIAEKFIASGGSIARPKIHIPNIGTLITCRDMIGHLFSFIETDSSIRPEKILS